MSHRADTYWAGWMLSNLIPSVTFDPLQVAALNSGQLALPSPQTSTPPSPPSLDLYFSTLLDAFAELVASWGPPPQAPVLLHVDCANGVGANAVFSLCAQAIIIQ